MTPQTHTVTRSWRTVNGWMLEVKGLGHFRCDEELPEGTAVVVLGQIARRP